jgi:hypothetical protein
MADYGKAIALGSIAMGGVFLWSAVNNKPILSTAKDIVSGTKPVPGPDTSGLTLAGLIPAAGTEAGSPSANYLTIARYLTANGYTAAAAAGIVGCIAGESGGDPESVGSGGNGLIGWTPPLAGIVTGNPTADLATQLPLIIEYNNNQGQELIAQLNAITNPVQAAMFYSIKFERPAVPYSDVRPATALSIYNQLTSATPTGTPGTGIRG